MIRFAVIRFANLRRFGVLTAISCSICFGGCQQDPESHKAKFLADMIAGVDEQKKDLLKESNGIYEDIRVFKDGKQDVVVFERKLAKGFDSVATDLKEKVISDLKSSKSSRKAFDLGISIRLIDKSSEGNVVSDFLVSPADLK